MTLVNSKRVSPNLVFPLILWRSGLGLLMGEFRQVWTVICRNTSVFWFQDNNSSKSQWIFTKFDMCIDLVEIWFGIAYWQIICSWYDNCGVLSFHVFIVEVSVVRKTYQGFYCFLTYLNTFNKWYSMKIDVFFFFLFFFFLFCFSVSRGCKWTDK